MEEEKPPIEEAVTPQSGTPYEGHYGPTGQVVVGTPARSWKKPLLIGSLIALILLIAAVVWQYGLNNSSQTTKPKQVTPTTAIAPAAEAPSVKGIQLDPKKDYGNKYQNGLLPVGDGKYMSTSAKKGYVYACSQYAQNLKSTTGGAGSRGPWFTNNNTQYDITKKVAVSGDVTWQSVFSNQLSGTTRTITSNDLPTHPTGIFPIARNDPAYLYDRNPNTIKSQSLSYNLPASPVYGDPTCMGGQVGIMLTGVALFNGFDAGGRDAGAWEVQDNCSGHPEKTGEYHYHTLSSCIKDTAITSVIGYALDGFPITGPKVAANSILTTDDLDECHGLTSTLTIDGKQITTYHYVMTQDFPYSVSCFRAPATQPPNLKH